MAKISYIDATCIYEGATAPSVAELSLDVREVTIGLRPESATLSARGAPGALDLTVRPVEELGADAYVYGELSGAPEGEKPWVVRCEGRSVPHIGDRVGVSVDAGNAHLFNAHTGLRLSA